MFFAQNAYGVDRLIDAYQSLPIPAEKKLRAVTKFLNISERTFKAYLSGKSDPPRAVVYALWHESPAGHAVTSEHATRGEQLQRGYAKALEDVIIRKDQTILTMAAELARLKLAQPSNACANDPVFKYL